ncbi:hypothetical protein IX51_03835 [uncultured archaeon]|nr:hypothetical protein IX51_03835 [uncultured archaeon]
METLNSIIHRNCKYPSKWAKYILLVVILIISAVLRIYSLSNIPPSLYFDEMNNLQSTQFTLSHIGSYVSSLSSFRVLFDQLLNGDILSTILFGGNINFAARIPTAIYGTIMPISIYLFTKELLGSSRYGYFAALLWAISPLSIISSRYEPSNAIFPAFIFLIFVYSLTRLRNRNYALKDYAWFLLVFSLSVALVARQVTVWAGIPIFLVSYFWVFTELYVRLKRVGKQKYLILTYLLISITLAFLVYDLRDAITQSIGIPAQIDPLNLGIVGAISSLSVRAYFFMRPQNMVVIDIFPTSYLSHSPDLTPVLFISEAIFFYASVVYLLYRFYKGHQRYEILLLFVIFVGGYSTAILNQANSPDFTNQTEAIISEPIIFIITSILFFRLFKSPLIEPSIGLESNKSRKKNKFSNIARILSVLFIALLVVNFTGFVIDLFDHYDVTMETNTNFNPFYATYGIDAVSNYIVANNLSQDTVYYYPYGDLGNYINLTSKPNIDYYYYHLHFPSLWLKEYSHDKINKTSLLYPGQFPTLINNSAIVITQNKTYQNLLSSNGFSYEVLKRFYRPSGITAFIVLKVYGRNSLNYTGFYEKHVLYHQKYSYLTISQRILINESREFGHNGSIVIDVNSSNLRNIGRVTGIITWNLNSSLIGYGYASDFPWVNGGNHSVPVLREVPFYNKSLQFNMTRYFVPNIDIKNNMTYMMTVTWSHSKISCYYNNFLVGSYTYPHSMVFNQGDIYFHNLGITSNIYIFNSSMLPGYVADMYSNLIYQ